MAFLEIAPPFRANAKQREYARLWQAPGIKKVLMGGSIRSGKTQAAGRLIVESALQIPSTYLIARLTYRELEDSTKKVMLFGDGSLPPSIPPEVIAPNGYRASDNKVVLSNGAELLFRSLEPTNVTKLLNLTLGGVLIDQIEELPMDESGERMFDALFGRLSDPRGPRKLLAVANPASTIHWVYRRMVDPATRDPDSGYVHVTMRDNADHLPADYVASMEATRESRPHWYRTYVLGEWGAIENAAYPMFNRGIHCVEPFRLPREWERFEAMDYGSRNPTAWAPFAVDYDGNVIVFDLYYSPGQVSEHATAVLERRLDWYPPDEKGRRESPVAYAPPDIHAGHGFTDPKGRELTVETEFADHGIGFGMAQTDRRAGYVRIAEALTPRPERVFPGWHPRAGERGAPGLFFFDVEAMAPMLEQVRDAPLEDPASPLSRLPGEAVAFEWEGRHGHAHAALRYGLMSRPVASDRPAEWIEDPRRRMLARIVEAERETDEMVDEYGYVEEVYG